MGEDIKKIKTRLKSIESTLHLAKATELVASSKIKKATDNAAASYEYVSVLEEILGVFISCGEIFDNIYIKGNGADKSCVIAIAGDRGLAGGYNYSVFRELNNYCGSEIIPIGKKACEHFGEKIISAENFSIEEAKALSEKLCCDFKNGKYKEIIVVSTEYVSAISQRVKVTKLLPIERRNGKKIPILFDSDVDEIFDRFIVQYVAGIIFGLVQNAFLCETASRRNAMNTARKNADNIARELNLKYNIARQTAITREITEIVAGTQR